MPRPRGWSTPRHRHPGWCMYPVSMLPVSMRPVFMRRFTAGGTGMAVVKGGMNNGVMNAGTSGRMTVGAFAAVGGGTTEAMVIAEGHALGP